MLKLHALLLIWAGLMFTFALDASNQPLAYQVPSVEVAGSAG